MMRSLHALAAKTSKHPGAERCQADLGANADPMRVRIADLGESGADRLTSHDAQFACPCSKDM